jgi:hypothetical protein
MHVKLLVALATARCCPSPGWLARQQETLARALAGDESDVLDAETAAQVRRGKVLPDAGDSKLMQMRHGCACHDERNVCEPILTRLTSGCT